MPGTKTPEKEILLTTTDTLPQAFTPLGLVSATGGVGMNNLRGVPGAMTAAEASLTAQALALDADAVIGIRVASFTASGVILTGTVIKFTE